MNDVYARRPDLEALRRGVRIAGHKKKLALSAMLPNVALVGAYTFSNPIMYDGFKRRFKGAFSVGATLTIPLWHWGGNYTRYSAAAVDETVMQRAADCFVGTHDFAAVRSVGTDVKSTVRTVYYYKIEREGDLISLRVCANGFLYNMARAMAGTCVYAAEGKFPPEDVAQILLNGDRTAAGPTVPPGGLYMTKLWYDDGKAVFHVG